MRPLRPSAPTLPPKRPLGPVRKLAAQTVPAPAPTPTPSSPPQAPPAPRRIRHALWTYVQWALVAGAALLLGGFAESLMFGQLILFAYGIAALVMKIKSNTTFALAIISIVTVVIFFTIQQNGRLANNFAVYTFWLLVIGTLSLVIEVRRDQVQKTHHK